MRHNADERCFEATVDGHRSVLNYDLHERVMTMTHTYVPAELRGRGLAEKLVRSGLAFARDGGFRVVPACSYVGAFIQRHAEYQPLLA